MKMNFSHIISALFHDKPGVMYENPPPPSDNSEFDLKSIFFTYPRPQSVKGVDFIKINHDLIHKSLLGYEEKEEEQTSAESTLMDGNFEHLKAVKAVEPSIEVSMNESVLEKEIDKSKVSNENLVKNGALGRTKIKFTISRKDSAVFLKKIKEKRQKNKSKEEKRNTYSDNSKINCKKKVFITKSFALQSISKSYSTSESDSDDVEKLKTKSTSHQAKSHSKISCRLRSKDKDSMNDTSYRDGIPYDKVGLRCAEFSVKKEFISSDEESLNSSFSKKAEITIKKEVLSDKDDYKNEKIRSSKKKYDSKSCDDSSSRGNSKNQADNFESCINSKSCDEARNQMNDSQIGNDSKSYENTENQHGESKKYEDSTNHEDIKNQGEESKRSDGKNLEDSTKQVDSQNCDDSKNHDDSKKNNKDYSIYSDDDSKDKNVNPCMPREVKQEMKQELGNASSIGLNDFYCDVCKLILNSETTFSSHMAGKRHKKALRQLSEQEVAKSSILEITESQNFPRPPDVDRIQLYDEESRIQETCEDADLLIVGLDYVREIRGYEDTKYFCELCYAQCVANSIIKHLIGFKHQMNCLKQYCVGSYTWVKDLDRRDKRVDREIRVQLEEAQRRHGKGRIRVFRDVKRNQRSPDHYNPYHPSTSRPILLPGEVQGKNPDELIVTDEDCLSRDFSDFYCRVCDSHMNNYSMWESHARGKRHAKNKKKAPVGLVTNNNFVEAPRGTISNLEEMILDECGPDDIIVGLNFIRENQGENGDLYNCYLCGSVCPTIDIIDHLYLKKHKTKYLEKMLSDGYYNAINEISCLPIGETAREVLIDAECEKLMLEFGRGRPVICVTKKIF